MEERMPTSIRKLWRLVGCNYWGTKGS